MPDITQILLVVVVITLTIVLTIIGIQFALILREVRRNIEKVGPILDNVVTEQKYINDVLLVAKSTVEKVSSTTSYVTDSIVQPAVGLMALVKGATQIFGGLKKIKNSEVKE